MPPGKESFVYHSHRREEEWIYVLSGRGVVEAGEEEIEVATGDFPGFPAPQTAHQTRDPFEDNLVKGEALDMAVADFPSLGKRILRRGEEVEIHDASDAREFAPLEG